MTIYMFWHFGVRDNFVIYSLITIEYLFLKLL